MPATRDALRAAGTIAADAQSVSISPNGRSVVGLEITGIFTINLDVKGVIDGTEQNPSVVTEAGAIVSLPLTGTGIVFVQAVGYEAIIVRANGYTSGSAAIVMNATDGALPTAAGGSAVSISDGSDAALGAKADAAASTDTGTFSLIALTKRGLQGITTLISQTVGLLTVSDFDTKTGALTETAPATDTASSGLNGRLQRVAQRLTTVLALFPSAAALATGTANPTTTLIGAFNSLFNGTTWDPQTGAVSVANVLSVSGGTTTQTSAAQTNYNCRGIILFLNITAASGTGGLTPQVQMVDPGGTGAAAAQVAIGTAQTTTGLKVYQIYPGVATPGALTAQAQQIVPRTFKLLVAVGDSSAYSYTLSYCLIP